MIHRVAERFTSWRADPALRYGLLAFGVLRLTLAVWVWGVRQVYPAPLPPDPVRRPHLGVAVETHPWLEPWQRWDTLHYQAIAERGYTAFDTALFTPPLYPTLMRWLAPLLGGNTLLAGLVISNTACALAFTLVYRLSLSASQDPPTARRTLLYLASFPTAFFLLAAYTEAVFLAAACMMLASVRRARWLTAGLWAALASSTRLPGALVLVPLVYAAWRGQGARPARRMLGVALGALGAAAFPAYAWLALGQTAWEPFLAQARRFGGGFTFPGFNLIEAVRQVVAGDFYLADLLDILALVGFLALAVPVWRKLPRVDAIYYLAFLGLYLTRIGGDEPLIGTTRYVLTLFPGFVILGQLGRNPWVHRAVLYTSWLGLLFLSAQFAIWGWVG